MYKYLDGGDLEAVISGLVPGKVYKLRVLAYSWGGDGKMSSPAWEFRVGEGSPSHMAINSVARNSLSSSCYSLTAILITLIVLMTRIN